MRKNILALCAALTMVLSASIVFADQAVPEHPCVKPEDTNVKSISIYESCMAEFIASQKEAVANHEAAAFRLAPEDGG